MINDINDLLIRIAVNVHDKYCEYYYSLFILEINFHEMFTIYVYSHHAVMIKLGITVSHFGYISENLKNITDHYGDYIYPIIILCL